MDYESNEIQCNREGVNLDNRTDGYDPIYHPWRRYFARMYDMTIMSIVFFFFGLINIAIKMVFKMGSDNIYLNILFGILPFILLFLYNSIFLSSIGTTPGKAMLGIKVINKDGEYLSFSEALKRELYLFFYVFLLPFLFLIMALISSICICFLLASIFHEIFFSRAFPFFVIGLAVIVFNVGSFFVFLFPLFYQQLCLKKNGRTSYDSKIHCDVICEKISVARMIFAFVLFVILPFLIQILFSLLVFLFKQ